MVLKKGFGLDLMDRIQNEGVVHQELIESIEEKTQRNLICYASNFPHPAGAIMEEDDEIIENVLKSIDLTKYDGQLDFMIHSRGGSPTAADKIIQTCRSYSTSFRVIVPKTAMSAATLVAMGSDSVLMSESSELGPIDPQMIYVTQTEKIIRPASAFVNAYLDLINAAQDAMLGKRPPHPYLELLRRIDPTWIQICLKARVLSRTIATEYLKKFMLRSKSDEEIAETVEKFIKTGEELAHGRSIRAKKAKEYGLNIEIIDKDSDLWKLIWELFMRSERYVQVKRLAKYIICRSGGVVVQAELVRI